MLTDLRAVNAVIVLMGALQPGLPNPSMIPRNLRLFAIDLRDCFFISPLHPDDKPRFAFSVPSINLKELHKRFQYSIFQYLKVCLTVPVFVKILHLAQQ